MYLNRYFLNRYVVGMSLSLFILNFVVYYTLIAKNSAYMLPQLSVLLQKNPCKYEMLFDFSRSHFILTISPKELAKKVIQF